jgi:uncharacterized repeat protein (TIGR02543 family)
VRSTFFVNAYGLGFYNEEDPVALRPAFQAIYDQGHEVGNHTSDHHYGFQLDGKWDVGSTTGWADFIKALGSADQSYWAKVIGAGNDSLVKYTTIPVSSVVGFRAPYLQWREATFLGAKSKGITYDCSIEEGALGDGKSFRWPYTLDAGSPGHNESWNANSSNPDGWQLGNIPGFWELPVHLLIIPPNEELAKYGIPDSLRARIKAAPGNGWVVDRITAFDYNLWSIGLTKADVLGMLKYNFDLRYNNNRAPFMFGAHTQYYDDAYDVAGHPNATSAEMRAAIEEFITYALSKSDTRMVPGKDIIAWCANPKQLGGAADGPYKLTVTATNGTVAVSPQKTEYAAGTEVTLTATPSTGYDFTGWSGSGASGTTNPLKITMNAAKTITATFTKQGVSKPASENLVTLAGWEAAVDDMGSKVDTGTAIIKNDIVTVKFTQVKMPNDSTYPWVNLTAYLDSNLVGVDSFSVTYKCDKELSVVLDQPPLSEAGTSYQKSMPASATAFGTQKFGIKSFAQPSWVETADKAALDLSKVTSISFVPTLPEAGGAASVEIKEVILYGYKGSTVAVLPGVALSRTASQSLIQNMSRQSVSFTVPADGIYELALFSLDGQKLTTIAKRNFAAGSHMISWNAQNLPANVYVVSLRGNGVQSVRKGFVN